MAKIAFKKVHGNAQVPVRATADSAGFENSRHACPFESLLPMIECREHLSFQMGKQLAQRRYVTGFDGFGFEGFCFDGMCRPIFGKFDATNWQNSLIERKEEAEVNTKRIILCVNACDGFSNEDLGSANLFTDYLESLREIVTMTKQRDGLLAELKATESRLHEVSTFCATVEQQRDELLNILQRLKAVDFGEHWNSDAEQAAIAARELIRKFELESVK